MNLFTALSVPLRSALAKLFRQPAPIPLDVLGLRHERYCAGCGLYWPTKVKREKHQRLSPFTSPCNPQHRPVVAEPFASPVCPCCGGNFGSSVGHEYHAYSAPKRSPCYVPDPRIAYQVPRKD